MLAVVIAACARPHITLPTDPGVPLPDFRTIHMQVSGACAGVRTLTAEMALSGRAGRQRLRGRVLAGFARPASMRLEGVAPFGPPAFILVARGENATLLLPRDERVLRGAKPEDILGALAGVTLGPADLQAILTGCVLPMPQPTAGRRHANGWASIDLAGGATIFLQPVSGGMWTLRGARRAGWQIEYPAWSGNFPQSVRFQSDQPTLMVDLTVGLSQIETNKDLDDAAFTVNVPRDAVPITLDELRDSGPLGAR
jgi:outer membrane lipoprotein-sorting protein